MVAAMGATATRLIVAGEYSWNRFLYDSASNDQLQEASERILSAHGDSIPFRPGEKYAKENGIAIFPMQRVNDLMQAVAAGVAKITNQLLLTLRPNSGLCESLKIRDYHDYFQEYNGRFPNDLAVISVLFGGVHAALMAKNDVTRGIRHDLHSALRQYYKIDPQSAEGKQEMDQVVATLDGMRSRFRTVIRTGYYACLPEAQRVLGQSMPAEMGAVVMRLMSSDVRIPGQGEVDYLISKAQGQP